MLPALWLVVAGIGMATCLLNTRLLPVPAAVNTSTDPPAAARVACLALMASILQLMESNRAGAHALAVSCG